MASSIVNLPIHFDKEPKMFCPDSEFGIKVTFPGIFHGFLFLNPEKQKR
jgi:hypothetical protein